MMKQLKEHPETLPNVLNKKVLPRLEIEVYDPQNSRYFFRSLTYRENLLYLNQN